MSKTKILYILNVANKVNNFSYTSMIAAQDIGIEYHIAGNWGYKILEERHEDEIKYGIQIHQIDFIRAPYNPKNYRAYKQLAEIIEREKFDLIHCNTPVGGVLGRLVARRYKIKKVVYQAHGFHFYKGAPALNWMIYYPVERWLAHYTDALITINKEDYEVARKFHLRNNGKVYYVPGVGINTAQYTPREGTRDEKRKELGLSNNDFMLISAGDLIERKNYSTAIRAIAKASNKKIQYFICGKGPEEDKLKRLAKELEIESQVHFLGFRTDMKDLMQAADLFLFTTLQEGLPRSMMEAMASGLPCIASKVRGNTDLLEDGAGGYLVAVTDENEVAAKLKFMVDRPDLRFKMGEVNIERLIRFDVREVNQVMRSIYEEVLR